MSGKNRNSYGDEKGSRGSVAVKAVYYKLEGLIPDEVIFIQDAAS
jgi:hypothetical protein